MKVLYYTSPAYLDIAIEVINVLKKHVELHVLIEISPGSKVSNIIEVEKLPNTQSVIGISELIKSKNYKYLEPYFEGCASANFFVHLSKTGFSLFTLKASVKLFHHIKKLKPDIIHLENPSLRALGLYPSLFSCKKVIITLHDPISHIGEKNWKVSLTEFLFLKGPYKRSYFFYSEFSKNQFEKHYKNDKYPKFVQRMHPYTIYKKYAIEGVPNNKYILFFGRVSLYKGIESLIKAMPSVHQKFPNESLLIAGRSKEGFFLNESLLEKLQDRIKFVNRFIPTEELVSMIQGSKFVVCPYLEATQSGVLMTAFALNKPVIASNVGAFPEYIEQNVTGLLFPANDPYLLAKTITETLSNDFYKTLEENIISKNNTDLWTNNETLILNAFFS